MKYANFILIGLAFLVLFIPFIIWTKCETRVKQSALTDEEIIHRLSGLALTELFAEEASTWNRKHS